jgi:tetratricopeptide (TPR) repeat protein
MAVMPEKSLNELPRDLRMLFQKGNDALVRENYDYAIDLYLQVLEKEPTFFDCRKALRNAQFKKAGGGRGFFRKVLSSAGSSPLVAKGQIALRKHPAEALPIAEQIINHDPQSSQGHKLFVEAAMAMEMPRAAAMSLEILVANAPKDKALAIQFANALAQIGEAVRAERFLSEFIEHSAYDNELSARGRTAIFSRTKRRRSRWNRKSGWRKARTQPSASFRNTKPASNRSRRI